MTGALRRFIAEESGATAVEYGLIAALVSLAAGAIVGSLGGTVQGMWGWIRDEIVAAVTGALS